MLTRDDHIRLAAARGEVLANLANIRARLETAPDDLVLQLAERDLLDEEGMWRRLYIAGLPVRTVSRCPFTDLPVDYPIDDVSLSGPWWDYRAGARDWVPQPRTLYALTGALRIAGPITGPVFAAPGPAVPYVIPRLLASPDARAVLSSLPVGDHTAYVVTYFAPPGTANLPHTDEWGTGRWCVSGDDGDDGIRGWASLARSWDADDEAEPSEERDFELRPWIESGRLAWIAPGDQDASLRTGTERCPYLDLDGGREEQLTIGDLLP